MNSARWSLLLGIVCISIFPVLVRLNLVPSISSAFYRVAIAFVCILPLAIYKKVFKKYTLKLYVLMAICGVLFGSDLAVWNQAIVESSATQATLLTNLAPVWVGIGSFLFLKSTPTRNFWIGTVIALTGMIVLIGVEVFVQLNFDRAFLFGVLSGIFYAIYILLSKRILEETTIEVFMAVSLAVASIYLALLCKVNEAPFYGFTRSGWVILLIQGIVCQFIAWGAISYATQRMRATRVSLTLLSQALWASLLAWYFLEEPLYPRTIVGGLIVLLGIGVTFYSKPIGFTFSKK